MTNKWIGMERRWEGVCHRCGKKTEEHTMSRFNTDLICVECMSVEEKHPDYDYAMRAEYEATKAGNYNFPGVGWPGVDGRVADLENTPPS